MNPVEVVAMVMGLAGICLMFGGAIKIVIEGFKENIWWGLGMLFPCGNGIVHLVFVIMYWPRVKEPFFVWLGGVAVVLVGGVISSFK
jgi:hypothetical protein